MSSLRNKVGYKLLKVKAEIIRPADTTQYTEGDAISGAVPAVLQFELSPHSAGSQEIEILKMEVLSSVKQPTPPLINAYISSTTFAATADNSALEIPDATLEIGGAWLQLRTANYVVGANSVSQSVSGVNVSLAADSTKLYGVLQAANAYTPVSGEKLTVILWLKLV